MGIELIKANNITKVYGIDTNHPLEALHETSIMIEEGEFVAIMGPSGAGKSTLLSLLGTIDIPTTGKLFIANQEIRVYTDSQISHFRNKNLGFIFQDFNLLEPLTIAENISAPLIVMKKNKKYIDQKVLEVAKLCHIEEILHKHPSECSGGQRQRAAVCRGFVNDPKLIVADEPTGNLDSMNSHEILRVFQQLNERGTTIVMVTHSCQIASYSSKTLYVLDGQIRKTVERRNLSQDEYYQKLVELSSEDTEEFFRE